MLYWRVFANRKSPAAGPVPLLTVLLLFLTPLRGNTDLIPGRIYPAMACRADPGQEYGLFVPPGYTPEKTYPLLIAFDPGGRTTLPLDRFQQAAGDNGWILACPSRARNGPWEPVFEAMTAVWTDLRQRFPLDRDRIYVAGFSGGARAAALFSKVVHHPVRGIIACGAGLPRGLDPAELKDTFYLGVTGLADFNRKEHFFLQQTLKKSGCDCFFYQTLQGHEWPQKAHCRRLLSWLQILGDPGSPGPWEEVYRDSLDQGRIFESWDLVYYTADYYGFIARVFSRVTDTRALENQARKVKETPACPDSRAEEEKRFRQEVEYLSRFRSVLRGIDQVNPPFAHPEVIWERIRFASLMRLHRSDNLLERYLAIRVLSEFSHLGRLAAGQSLGENRFAHALLFYDIVEKCGDLGYPDYYRMAAASARLGRSPEALGYLREAIRQGFTDRSHLEKNPDFESLRCLPEFAELLEQMPESAGNRPRG